DLPDPDAAVAAVEKAAFVVSLELRHSTVTDHADVVFPVAAVVEKPGTFLDWEGRTRAFDAALHDTGAMPDQRVLHALADEMGSRLGLPDAEAARAELAALGVWEGQPAAPPEVDSMQPPRPAHGEAVLATWRMLLDSGRMQDGEPHLAGTARTPVVRLSADSAAEIHATEGDPVLVSTDHGAITLPLAITDLPDRVVWLPLESPGSAVYEHLAATAGDIVRIAHGATRSEEVLG
ncbi:MAG: molybdopterin-dependent oxidoreductase, partial [Rhodococcus sp. (in: high G+C Gram-positive bacteria)]|uniref:molybdopterin-dependent oxidoreductase n=1 Tax=Rhodococcus sp. TaxID=1831 RepID=UPI003BAF4630